ncbi:hypothetical protein [uncultured Methylobacterium sp.]|uniref:hypothetical protein n=1 Tax=uncultured Methylobacterium sp. TaxID=157278 RepID=UPI0035C97296
MVVVDDCAAAIAWWETQPARIADRRSNFDWPEFGKSSPSVEGIILRKSLEITALDADKKATLNIFTGIYWNIQLNIISKLAGS